MICVNSLESSVGHTAYQELTPNKFQENIINTQLPEPRNPKNISMFMAFYGSREDAIERLPSLDASERIEFGHNRISLIEQNRRVDVIFKVEQSTKFNTYPQVMLLEVLFSHVEKQTARAFVEAFKIDSRVLH